MTFSFSRTMAACAVLVLLSGCAGSPSWMNASSWFGRGNVAHSDDDIQIPKGPLQPPQAAPVPPVQKQQLPTTSMPAVPSALVPTDGGKTKVAILLPLSGKDAALGQAMLNAAQLAVFDVAAPNFELMPRDSGVTDDKIDMAVRDAVASGAQFLIGPLFAAHVPIVHNIAQANGLGMATLSTDTSLAAPGLFVMGFAPGPQVERVIAYAAAHGAHRFAALVPNNPYGAVVGQAFQSAVVRANGTVVAVETYDPARQDSERHVRELASRRAAIDAIFLPEGGAELATIANQLTAAGFDPHSTRVLGTGLWDVPGLAKQVPFVATGWYAASDPALRRAFTETYAATYGQEPPRLATLAYDATALTAVLARRGAKFDQSSLTNPNGFAGLDGIFRLSASGLVERGLAVLQPTMDNPAVIDSAPTTFVSSAAH